MVGGRRSNWKAIAGSLAGLSVTCGCCSLLPIHPDSSLSLVPSITLLFFSGLPFYLCLLFPFFLFVPFLVFHPRSSVLCPSLALFPSWTFSSPPHYASRTTTFSPPPPRAHPFPTDYINIYILSLFSSWLCQHILDCWALHVLQLVLMQLSNGDGWLSSFKV